MNLHFIKLGGSLITDKTTPLTPRPLILQRLAREIAVAQAALPRQRWLISHGSGSYGHVVGKRYATRAGVSDARGWWGFVQTGYIAAQLHRLVLAALLQAGIPAISFAPSAWVSCSDGEISAFRVEPVRAALDAGLTPVLFGDVAFDDRRGGTIISTEQVLAAVAPALQPHRITLVGKVDGVYEADPLQHPDLHPIPHLQLDQLPALAQVLGESHGIDVTGGMVSKIEIMADLLRHMPKLRIHLLSGELPGHLQAHLLHPQRPLGTTITS
ncbi:MAG: uridylate kinase [Chloroflexi bacterium]|nr:uridylate kinase [Chloroflexota bacterium]